MPYSTINDVTGLNKSANQQPSQNHFLCVQNLITTITFLSKKFTSNPLYFFLKSEKMQVLFSFKQVLENVISTLGSA